MDRDMAAAFRTWAYGLLSGASVALLWYIKGWYWGLPLLLLSAWFIPSAKDIDLERAEHLGNGSSDSSQSRDRT